MDFNLEYIQEFVKLKSDYLKTENKPQEFNYCNEKDEDTNRSLQKAEEVEHQLIWCAKLLVNIRQHISGQFARDMKNEQEPVMFLGRNPYSLREIYDALRKMPFDYVSNIVKNIKGNLADKETLLESVQDDDYVQFKQVTSNDRINFEVLENCIRLAYETGFYLDNFEGLRSRIGSYYNSLLDMDNPDVAYYITKEAHLGYIRPLLRENIEADENNLKWITRVNKEIRSAIQTYPDQENFNDKTYFDWMYSQYYYVLFVRYFEEYYDIRNYYVDEAKLLNRMLSHPSLLPYKLKVARYFVPLTLREEDKHFHESDRYADPSAYFTSVRKDLLKTDFEDIGCLFMIWPSTNMDGQKFKALKFRLFGYTSISNNPSELITDVFSEGSAPYIYYFIKGITDDAKHEDVYGKMKSFFATTAFPDDEADIPEPHQYWKDALADLFPTIFGGNVKIAKNVGTIALPLSPLPPNLYRDELKQIGDMFMPGRNFENLFYQNSFFSIEWNEGWDKLGYLFRVLYLGKVEEDHIVPDGNVPAGLWEALKVIFVNKKGDHPASIKTLSWQKLHEKFSSDIDPKFMKILKQANRTIVKRQAFR